MLQLDVPQVDVPQAEAPPEDWQPLLHFPATQAGTPSAPQLRQSGRPPVEMPLFVLLSISLST